MPLGITNRHSLMIHEPMDLYDAEYQLLAAMPKTASAVGDVQLAQAFRDHLAETEGHVRREEGGAMIEAEAPAEAKDAGLRYAARRVEHHEMVGYGCASTGARLLRPKEIVGLLQEALDEEGAYDTKLTTLALTKINDVAVNGLMALS